MLEEKIFIRSGWERMANKAIQLQLNTERSLLIVLGGVD